MNTTHPKFIDRLRALNTAKTWYRIWGVLFSLNFFFVAYYGFDLPIHDEWALYFPQVPFWDYLFQQSGTHFTVPTKVLFEINRALFDLNFYYQKLFNLFIYAGGTLLFYKLLIESKINPKVVWPCIALYFTAINWWPLYRADTNAYHFYTLFLLAGILFLRRDTLWAFIWGWLCLVACAFSFGSGVVAAPIVALAYAFRVDLFSLKTNWAQKARALALLLTAAYIFHFFTTHVISVKAAANAYPWHRIFWEYFAHLLTWTFGFKHINHPIAITTFLLVTISTISILWTKRHSLKKFENWGLLTYLACVLVTLLVITYTRALSPPQGAAHAKASMRFSIFAMYLVPYLIIGFSYIKWAALRKIGLTITIVFTVTGYAPYLDFQHHYKWMYKRMVSGLECMNSEHYRQTGLCSTICIWDTRGFLDLARKLDISFTKWLKTTHPEKQD